MAKRDGNIPSGWCITDYHSGCPQTFDHGNCSCLCHRGVKPAADKVSKPFTPFDKSKLDFARTIESSVIPKKDSTPKRRGRPPGSKNKPKTAIVPMQMPMQITKSSLSSMIKSMSS